jgi:hypothetical protein
MSSNAERQRSYRQRAARALRNAKGGDAHGTPLPVLLAEARVAAEDADDGPPSDPSYYAEDVAIAIGHVLYSLGMQISPASDPPDVIGNRNRQNATAFATPAVMRVVEMLGGRDYCMEVMRYQAMRMTKRSKKEELLPPALPTLAKSEPGH